jgi:hypothetical protein
MIERMFYSAKPPDRPEYDEEATELAYGRTVEFIHANLS